MAKIGKYEFDSLEQANTKINALGEEHNHTIVKLGFLADSTKYSVDVLWQGIESHPYGWATKSVDGGWKCVHKFAGVSYQENKM